MLMKIIKNVTDICEPDEIEMFTQFSIGDRFKLKYDWCKKSESIVRSKERYQNVAEVEVIDIMYNILVEPCHVVIFMKSEDLLFIERCGCSEFSAPEEKVLERIVKEEDSTECNTHDRIVMHGFEVCYAAIENAILKEPVRYGTFSNYFDRDALDNVRDKYGVELYKECLEAVKRDHGIGELEECGTETGEDISNPDDSVKESIHIVNLFYDGHYCPVEVSAVDSAAAVGLVENMINTAKEYEILSVKKK